MLLLFFACSSDPAPAIEAPSETAPVAEAEAVAEAVAEPGSEEAPAVDEPIEEAPGEEAVVDAPVEEAPAEPVEEAPVEEAPVEEAPPEEVPVDEVVTDEVDAPVEEPEPAKTVSYALGPSGSSLYVQVFKDPDTVGADLSHDHVVTASGWTGTARWNVDDPSQCALSISVPVQKLVVDAPKMRAAVGLEGVLEDGQRDDVRKNMLASDQLDAASFKTISFEATSCVLSGKVVSVTGDFTLHGVTKSITVPLTVTADDSAFQARGSFKIKGSDYGVEPFTAMFGALKNKDKMALTVKITGSPG
ncbi:MAG: YceI family protein [Proteobacteria bacterium]|nr:YceI family protein [Pseudomonadota bacterium]MCP4920418.1 YceI family protein [Pseudomonadota bacterium]